VPDSDRAASPLLEARRLTVGYGGPRGGGCPVLRDVDLRLKPGELVGLFGANGSGKSTLLRTLAGLQRPLAGAIRLGGRGADAFSPRQRARMVSVVLTGHHAVPRTRVDQLVAIGRHPYTNWTGLLTDADRAAVDDALRSTRMDHFKDRTLDRMSDGERQRAMIARAVAQNAPSMLLDEPTAFLDLPGKAEILRLLRDLAHERGLAILLSSHDLSFLLRVADRCLVMDGAGAIHDGAPEDLVLDGTIGRVFDRPGVRFNEDSGLMEIDRPSRGSVALQGSGRARSWTAGALGRRGFAVNPPTGPPVAEVDVDVRGGSTRWILRAGSERTEARSIAELLERLEETTANKQQPETKD